MADSMVFYESFRKAISKISDPAEALSAYEAIVGYGLNGEEPKELGTMAAIVFDLVKPQIDANTRRRNNGALGGRPKKTIGLSNEKPLVSESKNHRLSESKTTGYANEKPNVNVNVNVNDNVNANDNVNVNANANVGSREKTRSRFTPPTIPEVQDYCRERNNNVDPVRFVNFYEMKGWYVGKNKMKDWKAAVRTWEKDSKPSTNAFAAWDNA